jgi:carbamoyltransferase
MHVLGINAYHGGASACLIRDGQLLAAAEEERFNRQKYWAGFPKLAIRYCLDAAGITAHDLDHIAISRDPGAHLWRKAIWALRNRPNIRYLADRLSNHRQVTRIEQTFQHELGLSEPVPARFHHVEHHRAHMASAFFVSPFSKAAVLSIDGMGDFVSTMWGTGHDHTLQVSDAIHYPHSLGYLYTMVTQWLGFPSYGDEGKTMGLSSYGKPTRVDDLRDLVRVQQDGSFELNLDYFRVNTDGAAMSWREGSPVVGPLFTDAFIRRFGQPRNGGTPIQEQHQNMAASLQLVLEDALTALLNRIHRETGMDAIALAGGVALNSVFNGKIRQATPFRGVFIQPAAGDAGTALGAAYYVYHQLLGHPRTFVMRHAYTGPAYDPTEVAAALRVTGAQHELLESDQVARRAAELIADGKIVGWFQQRMEWGPRALGHRSIVADPRRAEMKDLLNARIKRREPFRPFAPSILEERTGDFFEQSSPDPFMLMVYDVKPEKRAQLAAVTHVDGTGRVQTVNRQHAPEFWQLITEFEGLTGVPVVLNTSFNENEPIVCTPEDALACYFRTHMDALVLGNALLMK